MVILDFGNFPCSVLAAFNELRLCAPLSLASNVAALMQSSFEKAAKAVLAYHRAEESTFNAQERGRFGDFCQVREGSSFIGVCGG